MRQSECCDWEGVRCSATIDHVIELSFYNNFNPDNYFQGDDKTWFLNVSLLHPFNELRNLDFSFNTIGGWLGNENMLKFELSFYIYIISKSLNLTFIVVMLLLSHISVGF